MTQDEIIEMAREAGCGHETVNLRWVCPENLEAFVKLVEDAAFKRWAAQTKLAVEAEREACHALRQTLPNPHKNCQVSAHAYDMALVAYGSAIRARDKNV
jgi:hypothetical protein